VLPTFTDPKRERHSEFSEWAGQPLDPSMVNAEKLAQAVKKLAKQWTRKPAVNRKKIN
jgi:hypothetical protein